MPFVDYKPTKDNFVGLIFLLYKIELMLKVGITGGIGVGKTTVCKIFATLGIPIYEADSRSKWLLVNDLELKQQIQDSFGQDVYLHNGGINRDFLATQIFSNPLAAKHLESLIHPAVRKDFKEWLRNQSPQLPYILKEAALLVEAGSYRELDKLIVVTAAKDLRIKRVLERDTHRTQAELEAIMLKQLPEEEKIKRADFVVYNNEIGALIPQVLAIHQQLCKLL
jgi:dephospho-CoA kinase